MNRNPLGKGVSVALVGLVAGLFATPALAQVAQDNGNSSPAPQSDPTIGGATNPLSSLQFPVTPIPNQNLTPQQLQMLMQMRALQSRGGRGIRTGYPQFIPLGMPGMMPFSQGTWPANQGGGQGNGAYGGGNQNGNQNGQNGAVGGNQNPVADPADPQQAGAPRKTTKERRAEAKKAAEEKKKAAREAREAKMKEKAAKAKEAKTTRDAKKAAPAKEE